jgi:hypothetical protein
MILTLTKSLREIVLDWIAEHYDPEHLTSAIGDSSGAIYLGIDDDDATGHVIELYLYPNSLRIWHNSQSGRTLIHYADPDLYTKLAKLIEDRTGLTPKT